MATPTTTTTATTSTGLLPRWSLPTLPDRVSYDELLGAYLDCRRRKRTKRTATAFEVRLERNIRLLMDELNGGSYEPEPSSMFVVLHPKPREVWAASFRDRIVHHFIYNRLGPFFERRFIEDSFACIRGRGTLAAVDRVEQFLRSATESWSRRAHVLQMDIANFFVSIDRAVLWGLLEPFVAHSPLFHRLVRQSVFHDPTAHGPILKTPELHRHVPKHKSLFRSMPGCGLPIGNLTSQFYANVYNDGLDQLCKHGLRQRRYARYVDDIIVVGHDIGALDAVRHEVDGWLRRERGLTVHPSKVSIRPAHEGVRFVGSVILPYRRYVRRMVVASARKAADMFSVNSYLGILRHHSSFTLRRSMCERSGLHHDEACTRVA